MAVLARYVFRPKSLLRTFSENGSSSQLSSFFVALGGILGVGNVTGVCAAIAIGGAGSVFWMWICAILSSVIKYAETVLAVHYREKDKNGNNFGGAFTYIKNALDRPILARFFAVLCLASSFTVGNITQTRCAADAAEYAFGIPTPLFSLIAAFTILIICSGGGKLITAFANRAVPPLCILYVVLCLTVIFAFKENFLTVTQQIFDCALTPKSGLSGIAGYIFSPAIKLGVTRGLLSNEAGCGSAPIAYACSDSVSPCASGILGMIEGLCDTLLLCSLTAYAVLLSKVSTDASSVEIAFGAFSAVMGETVNYILAVSVILFSLASISVWAFYGNAALRFLNGKKSSYRIYCIAFSAATFISAFLSEQLCWSLSDICISLMATVNIFAVLMLLPQVKTVSAEYFS